MLCESCQVFLNSAHLRQKAAFDVAAVTRLARPVLAWQPVSPFLGSALEQRLPRVALGEGVSLGRAATQPVAGEAPSGARGPLGLEPAGVCLRDCVVSLHQTYFLKRYLMLGCLSESVADTCSAHMTRYILILELYFAADLQ